MWNSMCTWPVLTTKIAARVEKQLATPAGITVASYPDCWWPWEGWRREPGIHSLCTHLNSWGIRS